MINAIILSFAIYFSYTTIELLIIGIYKETPKYDIMRFWFSVLSCILWSTLFYRL